MNVATVLVSPAPFSAADIAALEELERKHGPLVSVEKWMPAKGRHEAPLPVTAFRRSLHAPPSQSSCP